MNRVCILLAGGLLSAAWTAQAATPAPTDAAPPKPREYVTTLTPAQSPPLSAAQRAKLAALDARRPASADALPAAPAPKSPSFSTSMPATGGAGTVRPTPLVHRWAPKLERGTSRAPHAPDVMTALPPDPRPDPARAAAIARKPFTGIRAAGDPARKPVGFETHGAAPVTLSPAQLAKRAQVDSLERRAR